jgi:hypothetical protein
MEARREGGEIPSADLSTAWHSSLVRLGNSPVPRSDASITRRREWEKGWPSRGKIHAGRRLIPTFQFEENGMSDAGIAIIAWKPLTKNTLRGFAAVRLRNGLLINDVTVHTSHGKAWASLPSKPIVGADGQAQRDRETGKLRYVPILEWPDRSVADRFSAAVIDAIEAQYPGAVRAAT